MVFEFDIFTINVLAQVFVLEVRLKINNSRKQNHHVYISTNITLTYYRVQWTHCTKKMINKNTIST